MGRASRRKRGRRGDAASAFRDAMAEVTTEDRCARLETFHAIARRMLGELEWRNPEGTHVGLTLGLLDQPPWDCLGCRRKCGSFVVWQPDVRHMVALGVSERGTACIFYPLCASCRARSSDPSYGGELEDLVVRELKSPETLRVG